MARAELEVCGKTADEGVKQLLRSLSLYGFRPPMSREDSVFGRINQCFGAVETNERGSLHLHGLLSLQGNMHLSSILGDVRGEEEIHTHSPTCVKYAIKCQERTRELCRFKAPWRLAEKTAFTEDGELRIRRSLPESGAFRQK